MTIVYCDKKDCAEHGIDICRAKRINIHDGKCKTKCTWLQMMSEKPNYSEKVKDDE